SHPLKSAVLPPDFSYSGYSGVRFNSLIPSTPFSNLCLSMNFLFLHTKTEIPRIQGNLCPSTRKLHTFVKPHPTSKALASWVVYLRKHSPEVRPTRVFLPERFTECLLLRRYCSPEQ